MADDTLVSNSQTSSNPDIPVRATESADPSHTGKLIQHFRLDGGVGTAEAVVTLGQKAEAASVPVVLATEQDSVQPFPVVGEFSTEYYPTTMVGGVSDADYTSPQRFTFSDGFVNSLSYIAGLSAFGVEKQAQVLDTAIDTSERGIVTRNIPGGTQAVSAASLPLPTGAATEAKQTQPGVDIGDVTVNNAAGAAAVNIQDGGNSITVDAASLPLPTGAATEAKQDTGNTSLSSIQGSTTYLANSALPDSTLGSGMVGFPILGWDIVNSQPSAIATDDQGYQYVNASTTLPATVSTTGNITASAQTIPVVLGELKFVSLDISGTYGSVALAFEASLDGTNYRSIHMARVDANTVETATGTISNTTRTWEVHCGAATHFRVRSTAWASGTMAVRINNCQSDADPVPAIQTHAVTMTGTTITSQVPGTGATNLGKARDSAVGATDTGVAALLQRRDTPVANAGVSANLDYVHGIVSNYGGLWSTPLDTKGASAEFFAAPPLITSSAYPTRAIGVYSAPSTATTRTSTTEIPHGYYFYSTRTSAAGCTTTSIVVSADASTQCRRGDIVRVGSGTHAQGIYEWGVVASVATTTISLDTQTPLSLAITNGLTIQIWKPGYLSVNASNALNVSADVTGGLISTTPISTNKSFFEAGSVAFGTITNTLATFYTTTNQGYMCEIANTTNVELGYSLDGGASEHFIPADSTAQWNLMDIGGYFGSSEVIQIYYPGPAAPTRGRASFMLAYY